MIGLIRVELTRYRTRRVLVLLVVVAALLTGLVAFQSAWDTRPPSAAEIATAEANANIEGARAGVESDIAQCVQDFVADADEEFAEQQCRDMFAPDNTNYLPRSELDLNGTLQGNGTGIALLVIGLLIIAASIFAGADWASGSIRNQVLFEPRRSRVWAAKTLAVSLASGLIALVLLGGFWLALYLVAADRGVPHGSAVVEDVGLHLLRAVALAIGASAGAFALTMLFRHAVATLALLFTYSVGGEILIYLLPFDGVARWSLGNNVFGWLEKYLQYADPTASCLRFGDCTGPGHISHLQSGLYLLGLLVVALVGSWIAFRRRDL